MLLKRIHANSIYKVGIRDKYFLINVKQNKYSWKYPNIVTTEVE